MTSSNVMTGGVVGAIIATAVVSVFVLLPMYDVSDQGPPPLAVANNGQGGAPSALSAQDTAAPSGNLAYETAWYSMPLVDIFEKVEQGVVRINVVRAQDVVTSDGGIGTGFIYDNTGHIVTNAHVVRAAESISVTFSDGRTYKATITGVDKFTDIAVLNVAVDDPSALHPLALGDSSALRVGEPVAAIGNPFGLSGSLTTGIVSQVGRLIPSNAGYSIPDIIQIDAAINPGSSGGPLFNMRGEVVGINNAIQSTTGEFAGVGFAIPSQTVMQIAPALISDGSYAHPWIGISGRDVGSDTARLMELDEAVGFLVVDVMPESPADEAGLRQSDDIVTIRGEEIRLGGDVILGVDGNEVRKIDDILIHLQRSKSVGDEITLQVLRDGQELELTLTLQQRPE